MNVRAAAARALAPIMRREASLQSLFDNHIDTLAPADKGLFHELVYGTLRKYEALDAVAKKLLKKPLKNKDQDIYALILLGLYQLNYLRTPDHAAISATVDAARSLKKIWAKNVINAVLRNAQRKRQENPNADIPDTERETGINAAATYLLPGWMVRQLSSDWGESICRELAAEMQSKAPLTVRINLNKTSRDQAIKSLRTDDIELEPCRFSESGIHITSPSDVVTLPGFAQGWLSVQDEAAQLASNLLDLEPGLRVLDACAAPGGKTAAILESEPLLARVTAIEVDPHRAEKVTETLSRLKLNADLIQADAADLDTWWDGEGFDRILLDAPCSASGVIRRHPDIKLLRRHSDLSELAAQQKLLLNTLWTTLKQGGVLVYATCSVFKNENETPILAFLDSHPDALELVIDAPWGQKCAAGRQLFPQAQGHDGFFYAKIKKKKQ